MNIKEAYEKTQEVVTKLIELVNEYANDIDNQDAKQSVRYCLESLDMACSDLRIGKKYLQDTFIKSIRDTRGDDCEVS